MEKFRIEMNPERLIIYVLFRYNKANKPFTQKVNKVIFEFAFLIGI